MIRITIELLPNGNEKKKSTLGCIEIINNATSKDSNICNYDYKLYSGNKNKQLTQGRIERFPRNKYDVFDLLLITLKDALIGSRTLIR